MMVSRIAGTVMLLAMPAIVFAQVAKPLEVKVANNKTADADKKLAELEAKLQALLAEIKAMRSGSATPTAGVKTEEMKIIQARIIADPAHKEGGKPVKVVVDPATVKPGEGKKIAIAQVKKPGESKEGEKTVTVTVVEPKPGEKTVEGKRFAVGHAVGGKEGEKRVIVTVDPKTGEHKVLVNDVEVKGPEAKALFQSKIGQFNWKEFTPPNMPRVWEFFHAHGGDSTTLTRVIYGLAPDKAKALESFLKENAKAKVLEMKLDGDKLTVTTTPDVQATIGGIVRLMQSDSKVAPVKPSK
jgi:hypothetical protein